MPNLRGFNAQVVPWSKTDFNSMAAVGAKFVRQVIFWDAFEPTEGTISPTMTAALDAQVARATAAGLYSMFSFHLNVGRDPAWTMGLPTELDRYRTYGRTLTQFLAERYGNPASPEYTPAVVGMGLNEPPLDDSTIRNGNGSIPYLEGIQRTIISWFRASAPQWIGFVAFGYGAAAPIYNPTFQNANAINADPHAYDSVGGDVVIDFHDYMVGVTGTPTNGVAASDPTAQVRLWNGMPYPEFQGGPMVGPDSTPAPTYVSSATIRAQMSLYVAPYKAFSIEANIPLMVGEWGSVPTEGGATAWITDMQAIWAAAGTVIESEWDYNVTTSTTQDPWAAYPGHRWQSSTLRWMGSTE